MAYTGSLTAIPCANRAASETAMAIAVRTCGLTASNCVSRVLAMVTTDQRCLSHAVAAGASYACTRDQVNFDRDTTYCRCPPLVYPSASIQSTSEPPDKAQCRGPSVKVTVPVR